MMPVQPSKDSSFCTSLNKLLLRSHSLVRKILQLIILTLTIRSRVKNLIREPTTEPSLQNSLRELHNRKITLERQRSEVMAPAASGTGTRLVDIFAEWRLGLIRIADLQKVDAVGGDGAR